MTDVKTIINDFKELNNQKKQLEEYAKIGRILNKDFRFKVTGVSFLTVWILSMICGVSINDIGNMTYHFLTLDFDAMMIGDSHFFSMFFTFLFWRGMIDFQIAAFKLFVNNDEKQPDLDPAYQKICRSADTHYPVKQKELQDLFEAMLFQYDKQSQLVDMDEIRRELNQEDINILNHLDLCVSNLKRNQKNKNNRNN